MFIELFRIFVEDSEKLSALSIKSELRFHKRGKGLQVLVAKG